MKLLLFSDLHADAEAARSLLRRSKSFDVLVGAGDFGNVRRQVGVCIEILKSCGKPAVLVPGNAESVEELRVACRVWPGAVVLHGNGATVAGVEFFGLGGGVPVTPFGDWSYDFSDEQAAALLKDCPAGCVLVTHSPPKGAVDVSSSGKSIGSVAIRAVIERCRPVLAVCGHVHACGGKSETVGPTPVVNAGPNGVEWSSTTCPFSDPSSFPNPARRGVRQPRWDVRLQVTPPACVTGDGSSKGTLKGEGDLDWCFASLSDLVIDLRGVLGRLGGSFG